jgi:hypothetical protein
MPAHRIHQDGLDRHPGPGIHEHHARALRGKVLVAPGEQRDENRTKIVAARGGHIFIPRRPVAVAAALKQTHIHQAIETASEHIRRDTETLLELVEPLEPVQRIAQNQDAPPLAHALEAACNRTGHLAEAFALH